MQFEMLTKEELAVLDGSFVREEHGYLGTSIEFSESALLDMEKKCDEADDAFAEQMLNDKDFWDTDFFCYDDFCRVRDLALFELKEEASEGVEEEDDIFVPKPNTDLLAARKSLADGHCYAIDEKKKKLQVAVTRDSGHNCNCCTASKSAECVEMWCADGSYNKVSKEVESSNECKDSGYDNDDDDCFSQKVEAMSRVSGEAAVRKSDEAFIEATVAAMSFLLPVLKAFVRRRLHYSLRRAEDGDEEHVHDDVGDECEVDNEDFNLESSLFESKASAALVAAVAAAFGQPQTEDCNCHKCLTSSCGVEVLKATRLKRRLDQPLTTVLAVSVMSSL